MWKTVFIGVFAFFMVSCFSDYGSDIGNLTINLGISNSRSVNTTGITYPPVDDEGNYIIDLTFEITLTGNGERIEFTAESGNIIRTTVPVGRWNIEIKAYYLGLEGINGNLYATGTKTEDIKTGHNVVNISMEKAFIEYNKFIINGITYGLSSEKESVMGVISWVSEGNVYVVIYLDLDKNAFIELELNVPDGDNLLVAGEYKLSDDPNNPLVFTYTKESRIFMGEEESRINFTGGIIKVSFSENDGVTIYTIEIDCTLEMITYGEYNESTGEYNESTIDGSIKGVFRGLIIID